MRTVLALALLAAALPASAAGDYSHGRFRLVEGGVSVQGAEDTGSEEATRHLPYLPGDRVWTDREGRVEFQFADGSLLRLDYGSKLDYVEHVEGRQERVALRLWSGSLFLRTRDRDVAWEIDTPAGIVAVEGTGIVRVDAGAGEARVSVYEGEATIDAGQRITVLTGGQRAFVERGYAPSEAQAFDRAEEDGFSAWNASLDDRAEYAGERYLPEDVAVYGEDLEGYGDWEYEAEAGYVWRPHVAVGWQPYRDGRWVYTTFGWTWVPDEPWGWAPSHYGRWGYSGRGWYWIPGRSWSPAWVSWSIGTDYVGWCALGHRDRAVVPHRSARGHAVPRASFGREPGEAWSYARRADLGSRDLARRRVDRARVGEEAQRLIETPGVRLGRNLEPGATPRLAGARPRPGRGEANPTTTSRPTIGDSVPELRHDPATSIPTPRARRRGDVERRQSQSDQPETGATAATPAARARTPRPTGGDDAVPADRTRWGARGTRRGSTPVTTDDTPDAAAPRGDGSGGGAPSSPGDGIRSWRQPPEPTRSRWREDTPTESPRTRSRREREPETPSWRSEPAQEARPRQRDRDEGATSRWRTPAESESAPRTRARDRAPAEPERSEPAREARPLRSGGDDSVERFLRSLSTPRRRGGEGSSSDGASSYSPRSRGEDRGQDRAAPRGNDRSPERERSRTPRAEPRRESSPPAAQSKPASNSGRARHRNRDN